MTVWVEGRHGLHALRHFFLSMTNVSISRPKSLKEFFGITFLYLVCLGPCAQSYKEPCVGQYVSRLEGLRVGLR